MMKNMRMLAWLLCGFSATLWAADSDSQQNPDWPCDQILVTEIPPAVVWAGPSIEEIQESWRGDADVSRLVGRITSRDLKPDAADKLIEAFAAQQDPAQKERKLTLLFAGVIQTLNEVRSKELHNIIRYSRGQSERADRLSQDLDEMVRLQDDPSEAAKDRLALMQHEMELKQRMFDDREAFIQHLCTRPVVIEQQIGALARSIAYYLD